MKRERTLIHSLWPITLLVSAWILGGCQVQQTDLEEMSGKKNALMKEIIIPTTLMIMPNFKQMLVNTEADFIGQGGKEPYTFAKISGPGTLNASGHYIAPSTPGDTVIRVTDATGSTADALVTIDQELALTPSSKKMNVTTSFQFSASGGNAPYVYAVTSGAGSIDANGVFTAPPLAGQTIIRVTDNRSVVANATVSIGNGPIISPTTKKMAVSKTFAFSLSSGTAPFTWEVTQGGGSIDAGGNFTSPATFGNSTVRVTDSLGYSSEATIESFVPNQVATNYWSTCVLKGNTNDVKCFGFNQAGQLGNGGVTVGDTPSDMGLNLKPALLGPDTNPVDVANAYYGSCALMDDGQAKCWGYTYYGANGYAGYGTQGIDPNTMGANLFFVPIGAGRTLTKIEGGYYFNCGLMDNGGVKCWGYNGYGQLGQDTTANFGIDQGGNSLYNMPAIALGQAATKITVGYLHACAILVDGSVRCWGYNGNGELGRNNTVYMGTGAGQMATIAAEPVNLGGSTAVDISAGEDHTCVILSNGKVRCWGYNAQGQLGVGAVDARGNEAGEMAALTDISFGVGKTAVKITSGGYHSCAILNDGTLRCWGNNAAGQLGYGDTANRGDNPGEMGALTPVPLGTGKTVLDVSALEASTCAILNDNTLRCWGSNNYGQLGLGHTRNVGTGPTDMGDNLPAVDLGPNTIPVKMAKSIGSNDNCIVANRDGTNMIICFGQLLYGQGGNAITSVGVRNSDLGVNMTPVDLGIPSGQVKKISPLYQGYCALLQDDTAKCWGYNEPAYRLLGSNSTETYVGDLAKEMGTGLGFVNAGFGVKVTEIKGDGQSPHTCALLDDQSLRCIGYNVYGQLGQDTTANYTYFPTTAPINLGVGRSAVKFATTTYSTCAILDNGELKCWGYNPYGNLGYGDTANRGTGPGNMAALTAIDLGTGRTAKDVCGSNYNTCVLLDNDKMKCWGYNGYGQLGQEHTNNLGDGPGEMGDALPYINLGTGRTVKQLGCGVNYNCALLDNDKVKCWGYNAYGNLGYGNTAYKGNIVGTMGNALPYVDVGTGRTVTQVVAGYYYTCAVLDNNDVKCWGWNANGQLGLGHSESIGNEQNEMGDNLMPAQF
ncbi:MAG: hypothetical protein A2X86_17995 [Bdellovibrionales bacterium GWA2_49_15]|nr:MAG: hypothetical protein A2X86_17995 [Bdellovibrionales bacterium GWA2_49_15]HAZ11617.1 hypothetical protein [Bdellovibrionales bacterium]